MNPFLREKRDGTRAPGYLVYLLGGFAVIAGVLYLRRHSGANSGSPPSRRGQTASVGAITEPASMVSPVVVANAPAAPLSRSFRLKERPRTAVKAKAGAADADGFDAIDAALAEAPPPAASATPAESLYPALLPGFAPGPSGAPGQGKAASGASLLGYRDPSADPPANPAPGVSSAPPADSAGRLLIPRGTLMQTILLTTVDTGNPSAVIEFGLARSVIFQRREQIAFGTRLLGRLSGRAMRNRLNLTADTLLFPDGREWPIAATAVEADDSGADIRPGVAAVYVPPPAWEQLAPYVAEAFSGFMALLESRAQSQYSLGVGGLSFQASNPAGARAPLYQASTQALQDFSQARLKEVEERYASYYYIRAGAKFWLQLGNDLVVGKGHGP